MASLSWKPTLIAVAILAVALAMGAILTTVMPFWVGMPVCLICGVVIGQGAATRFFGDLDSGLPPDE